MIEWGRQSKPSTPISLDSNVWVRAGKWLVVLIGILGMLQGPAAAETVAKGDPIQGKSKAASCIACHGDSGFITNPQWPNLAGQGAKYLIKQISDIQSGVRPVAEMTPFVEALTDQDIKDIAAYYVSQTVAITGAQSLDSKVYQLNAKEYLRLGERVYRFGNPKLAVPACSSCHSPTGKGNAPAGYPAIGGQHRDYIIKQLRDFRSNQRINDGDNKTMRLAVENLRDLELEAVANYVSGLH